MSSTTLVLCQPSDGSESDWSNLYTAAFPQDERMPLSDLQTMITNKTMLLHRTTDAAGNLLCFSLVNPMSNFSLLAYIATDQTRRSSGVGTKHMKQLISILQATYQATHLGLFLEIESTTEPNISAAEQTERNRRLAFYQKLGCKRLCGKDYFMPSYAPQGAARHGEFLWFEYGSAVPDDATIVGIIHEIYTRAYGIAVTHPVYVQVLSQFNQAQGSYDANCPVPGISSGTSAQAPAPSQSSSPVSAQGGVTTPAPAPESNSPSDSTSEIPGKDAGGESNSASISVSAHGNADAKLGD